MGRLEFIYEAPPGRMSDLRVVAGHLGDTDRDRIRRAIDKEWTSLSVQDKGTRWFNLSGERTEFTFESRQSPDNPREPLMVFKVVAQYPMPTQEFRSRVGESARDTPEPTMLNLQFDESVLEDVILRYVIQRHRGMTDPEKMPADLLTLIGSIVVQMARETDETNRRSLASSVHALAQRYPDVAGTASLLGQCTQQGGGDKGLTRFLLSFRR